MRWSGLCLILFAMAAGCGVVNADDVDRSCETADDCVPAWEGSVCDCTCPTIAINVAAAEDHEANVTAARATCPPNPALGDCVFCGDPPVECREGTCVLPMEGDGR